MNKPHKARKRFGQNFLQDSRIIHQIIMAIDPSATDHLVEIGPGQGAITEPLLQTKCTLDVIELDRDLVDRLNQRFSHLEHFRLHSADALTFDFAALERETPLRIVGNLPYNISTPLMFHLLTQAAHIQDMHFMLQKEIVNRLQAQPGSKQFGRLSIMIQLSCQVEALFDVEPECFHPQPKVMSSIVRLTPYKKQRYTINDLPLFDSIVKTAFSQRRKTIRNTLKNICEDPDFDKAGIDPSSRAESLSIDDFVNLSNQLKPS
ncbi:MAG: 16S rRNA (adenine(1518)-N(6)/adenine(1519)-N(6))-dimethyltransferase [Cycloclasticus sp.]|nr:16S rRNA (adenine(1518)-N(6)/adenine(1519)-N(6))-dimethyltransferase [Cycloclasticus sp.]MBG96640.1 16S rRNA (adenine(1518)-N(6)/adenine(1519)-N(6))-dimethyltransferase [Cycloclasticus sp.]HAI95987.1 16S rRNA (adenine(1518)-N(6)/adenine(1519)-N(6))-dimethyltransferase [Methylococcaceae bacterium]